MKKRNKKGVVSKYKGAAGIDRVKNRRELTDQDYLNKLSPEEAAWMNKFNSEYVGATFRKTPSGAYSSTNLHKTKKGRKDCYNRNNARNRCELTKAKSLNRIVQAESVTNLIEYDESRHPDDVENTLISILDSEREET